ncbi:hypothetical protein O181_077321 [Austropuccinia psidii MF-1]|uniref:Integrase catalytic domain-containing protein n=1 Tax=Austropuccinia psidii MF-1 TaxID=1389203 RepID=A0A9Q3FHV0_9BASI|nr:hypothetical protein [Austropuccinia psidii MF-1]
MKLNAATGIPKRKLLPIKLCHSCSIAKSQHRPIKSPSRKMIQQSGDLIVADLMGPFPPSINNKKYALIIQDVFSRVTVAIALSNKSEAKIWLIQWMLQFMNVSEYKIKTIRTDNGTEFKNNIFSDFLKEKDINHEFSMPYEHHQNGQIERTNRTISEMERTSLITANLPGNL